MLKLGKKNCPKCNSTLKYQGDRKRELYTGNTGAIKITRAYYTCTNPTCNHTEYPLDKALGLSKQKVCGLLEEKICLLSAHMPFDHACGYLKRTEGIFITQKMVLGTAEANGETLLNKEEALTKEFKQGIYKNLHITKKRSKRFYLQVDGSMVPIRGKRKVEYQENNLLLSSTKKVLVKILRVILK